MQEHYLETITSQDIYNIAKELCEEEIKKIEQVCYRYGEETEIRKFDTFYLTTAEHQYVMKLVDDLELYNYNNYLNNSGLPVPNLIHTFENAKKWILIEKISGDDLSEMTDDLAEAAALSLSKIQNAYWQRDEDADRFNKYWKRILQRAQYVAEDPLLRTAYQLFLDRQLTCPKTLSIGDCLQENLISQDGIVYLVDWGFGGIMPYSLDIARFIAHGSEERKPFPYYITAHQKELFIDSLYEKLNQKPDKDVFIRDIKLSVLNEYIEFMEADEDIDGWYSLHARNLAKKILEETKQEGKADILFYLD